MNWLKRLFGMLDSSSAATARIGAAMDGLADDFEEVRRRVRDRFGLDEPVPEPPVLEATKANGRKRIASH